MRREWIRPLFLIAAAYDLVLGVAFLCAHEPIFTAFGLELPNHPAYIQASAAFVAIFGFAFWMVARAPERNRDIIVLGVLMKIAYAGIVFWYWSQGRLPALWMPMAVADVFFLAAFLLALRTLRPAARS